MSDWFCWECGWSGDIPTLADIPNLPKHFFDNCIFIPLCSACGKKLHSEAATERAAIQEYDGGMSRQDAEQRVEGEDA